VKEEKLQYFLSIVFPFIFTGSREAKETRNFKSWKKWIAYLKCLRQPS